MFRRVRAKNGSMCIETDSIWMSDNDFGVYANNPDGYAQHILSHFERCSVKYSVSFRIYRTKNGLRSFVLNLLPCEMPFAGELMLEVRCDSKYIELYRRTQSFHFRISAKRVAQGKTDRIESGGISSGSETAVCHFFKTVGTDPIHPTIGRIIDFHDKVTKASSGGTLA